jgi:hypothetical protein
VRVVFESSDYTWGVHWRTAKFSYLLIFLFSPDAVKLPSDVTLIRDSMLRAVKNTADAYYNDKNQSDTNFKPQFIIFTHLPIKILNK